jgi:ArsR family transcriptional regulator, arsenate/arsenite/antimonite-responsive transcriptional repressor
LTEQVPVDAEQFQRIAKALADPRRFEILEHIAKQAEVGCQRLCGCFPVRQATISHHLKELASAGLVESRKDGQYVYYRIRPSVFESYMSELRRRMAVRSEGQGEERGGTQKAPARQAKVAKAVKTARRKTAAAKRA